MSTSKRDSNKRSQTLCSILERQMANQNTESKVNEYSEINGASKPEKESNDDNATFFNVSPLDLPEDLLSITSPKERASSNTVTNYVHSIELFKSLIDQELGKAAKELEIESAQLAAWVDLQVEVPAKTILTLLRTIQNLHLDPLNEEIGFVQYEDGTWQTFISIEGCSKLLNHHEQFNGLMFTQADTYIDGVPEWVECSIYRKDRILPISVREHYEEVKGDSLIWQKMPRRMLRHRALQQCVRLAL
ncbi:hypothetical protein G6696_01705 [Polynucleobacter paneuropaeus]|nr:hypothetical protein G6696_01705 [Polynucleobacter paneuropaeus]